MALIAFSSADIRLNMLTSLTCTAVCTLQGTSRFLAQGGGGGRCSPLASPRGGILKSRRASRFFTNNMIFLECGLIALFEAFYMFRDNNHHF